MSTIVIHCIDQFHEKSTEKRNEAINFARKLQTIRHNHVMKMSSMSSNECAAVNAIHSPQIIEIQAIYFAFLSRVFL